MFEDRFEILTHFHAEDEGAGGKRSVSISDGILTVHVVRVGSDRVNPVETRHYRLVPVEQQWVEVQP